MSVFLVPNHVFQAIMNLRNAAEFLLKQVEDKGKKGITVTAVVNLKQAIEEFDKT